MFTGGTGSVSSALVEQRYQQWQELVSRNAPFEEIQRAEMELAEALKQAPFEIKEQFALIKQQQSGVDARQAFQQFRLQDGRSVMDRREQFMGRPAEQVSREAAKEAAKDAVKDAAKDAAKGSEKETAAKEAKAGHKAEVSASLKAADSLDQRVATKRLDEMLSKFERLVVERFEGGKEMAKQSADGKPHYAPKTEAEWKQFFKSFLDRTVVKKTLLDNIKQFFMRGVVQKGGKGIFIGDMHLANGRVEKFVRFSIIAEALARLRAMMPGSQITKEMLGKMSSEELLYLALAATRGREYAYSQEAAKGRFGPAGAEAKAAEALGIPLDQQLAKKARELRGRKGGRGGMAWYEKDGEPEELPYRFVPWWQWGNLNNPGPTKWITRAMYGALFIVSLIGIVAVTLRLLSGS